MCDAFLQGFQYLFSPLSKKYFDKLSTNNKKLFDKMQSKYDDKIYTIIKINKNTLDIFFGKNQFNLA